MHLLFLNQKRLAAYATTSEGRREGRSKGTNTFPWLNPLSLTRTDEAKGNRNLEKSFWNQTLIQPCTFCFHTHPNKNQLAWIFPRKNNYSRTQKDKTLFYSIPPSSETAQLSFLERQGERLKQEGRENSRIELMGEWPDRAWPRAWAAPCGLQSLTSCLSARNANPHTQSLPESIPSARSLSAIKYVITSSSATISLI